MELVLRNHTAIGDDTFAVLALQVTTGRTGDDEVDGVPVNGTSAGLTSDGERVHNE